MKVTYYGYHLKVNDTLYLNSAITLLRKYVQHGNSVLKNSFINGTGDSIFLFRRTNNFYALIVTKDNEIIKKINSENVTYEDIREDLEENERIGFASYIYFDRDHYAIASTVQGPKNKTFVDFINQLFEKLHINADFISAPFSSKVSRDEVLELDFVGKTTFEITPESGAFTHFSRFFGGGALPNELDAIEVTIKPRRGSDIKHHIPALNAAIGEYGVRKYILKAKESLADSLTDFYVTGNGFVSDYIVPNGEDAISRLIADKKQNNEVLSIKLGELREDRRYSHVQIEAIARFDNDSAWVDHISSNFESEVELDNHVDTEQV